MFQNLGIQEILLTQSCKNIAQTFLLLVALYDSVTLYNNLVAFHNFATLYNKPVTLHNLAN